MLFSSPCIDDREVLGEASAGACMGLVLSLVNVKFPGADTIRSVEGKTRVCVIASTCGPGVVLDPGTRTSSLLGTGRAARWPSSNGGPRRED